MGVQYVAEYDDGARVVVYSSTQRDEAAIYRECASLLRNRPEAHRVEAWRGGIGPVGSGQYVTKATRGVEVRGREDVSAGLSRQVAGAHAADERWPGLCFCVLCMPTPRNEDETKGEAT